MGPAIPGPSSQDRALHLRTACLVVSGCGPGLLAIDHPTACPRPCPCSLHAPSPDSLQEEVGVNAVTASKDECEDTKTEAQAEEDGAEGQEQDKKSPRPRKKKHKKEKEERTKGKKKSKKQPPGSEEAAGEAAREPVQNGAPEEEPLPRPRPTPGLLAGCGLLRTPAASMRERTEQIPEEAEPESSYSLLAENSYIKMVSGGCSVPWGRAGQRMLFGVGLCRTRPGPQVLHAGVARE
ncbi:hypothetical protein P7K49_032837 [Saguinus oedipus]|uniref:Uncharacterized protein n=1 Tax=Saguinus oedipus TaxID=9490 RepID=A0ABQ9TQ69_SAGOE|nr:hypothetical protein P7K49_032837 [Saguinus oedipus]